ncbi:MAG TPA: hypothetical protein VH834_16780 [Solirubrobacteraceae bacterium]
MIHTRLRHLAALVLVALAAGAIAARADDKRSGPVPRAVAAIASARPTVVFPKTPCVPTDRAQTGGAPPSQALLGAFAVLRRPRQPSDALPADALEALRRFGLAPISTDSARLLRSTPSGGRAWVVPVPDVGSGFPFLCRGDRKPREGLAVVAIGDAAQGGGGALADLVRGRATVSTDQCAGQNQGMLSVSGIVPDGVAAVFLTAPDGTAVRADVKDNAYEFVVAHPRVPQQRYVVWTGADGTPHVQPIVASATPRARLCEQISALATLRPRVSPGLGSGGACAVTPVLTVPVSPKLTPRPARRVRRGLPPPVFVGCGSAPPVVLAAPRAVPKRHK